jgi:hypothetical protein
MDFPFTCKRLANAASQSVLHTTEEARLRESRQAGSRKVLECLGFCFNARIGRDAFVLP